MTDTKKMLEDMVQSYAEDLEKAYDIGRIYECLNDIQHYDDDQDDEHDVDGNEIDFSERPAFEMLDIAFIIGGDGRYRGATVQLAFGGPGIDIDTRSGYVIGHWGFNEPYKYRLRDETIDEIDDYLEELYQCIR